MPPADGFAVLYVSPLKALINDQFRRLESLCETCDVIVTKRHGDVAANVKARARQRPSGIVLITPESLEALLVRRGGEVGRLFSRLEAVVIDELHAFIGTELLRSIGPNDGKLIEQAANGLLMVGAVGEEITESHDFYPVFATDVEYRIIHEARTARHLSAQLAAGSGRDHHFLRAALADRRHRRPGSCHPGQADAGRQAAVFLRPRRERA